MSYKDNRFTFKFLGVFTVEIVKVTPHEVRKTLRLTAFILFVMILLVRLPAYIEAVRWW
ncbi:hypothetical protein F945_02160 [Acinetobacter rudis CIP 110305]|uniref:Uncharacterized protein n=1 Tax=Acinetobacter rudis CIP 110305 TaxID=421052 RepID=S3MWE5_9GAMM|nr:hypothetical protein F945_02160 [Acinetobacter rudis CIP 110305]